MTEFRLPLPFQCDAPRTPHLTKPFRLEEDGRLAVLSLPEGSIVRLIQTYGLHPTHLAPEPALTLEWTLPNNGLQATLYWNGDGTYDGWDVGTNNPPDEPEKVLPMLRNTRILSDPLLDALNALPGVSARYAAVRDFEPYRAWFAVQADALARVLPLLAQSVATNYAGHPFRLLVDDTGDGASIGPIGTVVFCFESLAGAGEQVVALGEFIARHSHEVSS
jgi:hypothetical protein